MLEEGEAMDSAACKLAGSKVERLLHALVKVFTKDSIRQDVA